MGQNAVAYTPVMLMRASRKLGDIVPPKRTISPRKIWDLCCAFCIFFASKGHDFIHAHFCQLIFVAYFSGSYSKHGRKTALENFSCRFLKIFIRSLTHFFPPVFCRKYPKFSHLGFRDTNPTLPEHIKRGI